MIVELAITAGPHAGRSFRFSEHSTFIVGRSSQAHFSLPEKDPHVSRLHMLVEVNPPLCRMRNMSAVNGTVVNGVKVPEADLKDGDRITIGITELAVRLHGQPNDEVPTVELPNPGIVLTPNSEPVPLETGSFPAAGGSPESPVSRFDQTRVTPNRPEGDTPDIPNYKLVRVLGRGGMGVVYSAQHLPTGEEVAVKTVLPKARASAAALAKFVREADVLRRLDHPGIVKFHGSGVAGGIAWFAMEFVNGADAQTIADTPPLTVGRAVGWIVQALEALQHAHDRGFVHRDVKPANLLVTNGQDGSEVVKVADFGLARAYEASPLSGLTLTGSAGGTPPFMPPEQVLDMRSVRPAADQYAAAATLYRLLAGRHVHPACARVEDLFARILQSDPEPLSAHRPDMPAALVSAVRRALSRDPAARFPDCRNFVAALRPFTG